MVMIVSEKSLTLLRSICAMQARKAQIVNGHRSRMSSFEREMYLWTSLYDHYIHSHSRMYK